MWKECKRVIKDRGAIVLFCSQPFTTALIASNLKWFKYCWTWKKERAIGHLVVKIRPMQQTEDIAVFGKGAIKYFPIMTKRDKPTIERYKAGGRRGSSQHMAFNQKEDYVKVSDSYYPKTILEYSSIQDLHPTQKPVALLEYLVKTYTNEGDTVLDFAAGSFTTAVACINTNRHFIGIEKDAGYFEIGKHRIEQTMPLFVEVA